jgi:hypothetical protein
MANLDFPDNPEFGQEYKGPKGKSYWWDGIKWSVKRPVIEIASFSVEPGGIDFPPYPVLGFEFLASNGITYIWDGVKWVINQNVIIDNGSGTDNTGNYVLPTASNTRLGGVRTGEGIINQNGTISVDLTSAKGPKGDQGEEGPQGDSGTSAYEIAVANGFVGTITQWLASIKGETGDSGVIATDLIAGIVKIGNNINVAVDGTISVPTAADGTLGVVKPGANVTIDGNGAISVNKGAGINTVADIPDVNSTAGGAALNDGALLIYNASNERWDTVQNLRSNEMDGGFF